MIFLPSRVGDSEPFLIEFFEAKIEGSEMGLALIVLGLSCFLIGRKDLADLRTYQGVQEDLGKTSALTARLVADRVEKTLNGVSDTNSSLARLALKPELDLAGTRLALQEIHAGSPGKGRFFNLGSDSLKRDKPSAGMDVSSSKREE
jgi:hypothetical protein